MGYVCDRYSAVVESDDNDCPFCDGQKGDDDHPTAQVMAA